MVPNYPVKVNMFELTVKDRHHLVIYQYDATIRDAVWLWHKDDEGNPIKNERGRIQKSLAIKEPRNGKTEEDMKLDPDKAGILSRRVLNALIKNEFAGEKSGAASEGSVVTDGK
jgi:hypothetical protein